MARDGALTTLALCTQPLQAIPRCLDAKPLNSAAPGEAVELDFNLAFEVKKSTLVKKLGRVQGGSLS